VLDLVHKLWNKGVDIGANVITSLIVAVLGLLFWRVKLRLDLWADASKHRQKQQMDQAAGQFSRRLDDDARYSRLSDERDTFATAVLAAQDMPHLAELWESYLAWMQSNDLQLLPGNLSIHSMWANWGSSLRNQTGTAEAVAKVALEIETLINRTALRAPEPWEPKDEESNAALRKRIRDEEA